MNSTQIPGDVRRFIQQCIPSVPFLEAALLLRESRDESWTTQQLAQRLYLSTPATEALLRTLAQAGLANETRLGQCIWHYAPRSPELAHMLDKLALVYARHLVEVSNLIHLKSNRKAQLFAAAFVWRKDH
jgi:hypothetical protein